MANFHTHFNVALIASSALASIGLVMGVYGFFDTLVLTTAGTIGGLLPDIDLNHSKVSRIGFNIASGIGAGFGLLLFIKYQPNATLHALLWGGVAFLFFRYGVFAIFGKVTTHRGMVHSVPYMALIALLLVNFLYYILEISINLSWLLAVFVFFGAMVHLILDEIYSVNIFGLKVKKSFGTAFKFYDKKNPKGYAILYTLLGIVWCFSPNNPLLLKTALLILQQF